MSTNTKISWEDSDLIELRLKRKRPWWLLSFLLLLLLLIKCNDDICYKVIDVDNKLPIENVSVDFYLIMGTDTTSHQTATSNADGKCCFGVVDRRLYELIFEPSLVQYNLYKTLVTAQKTCYADSSVLGELSKTADSMNIVQLRQPYISTSVSVLNRMDKTKMESVAIQMITYTNGKADTISKQTNASGVANFGGLAICIDSLAVRGDKKGYMPDSLGFISLAELYKRKLKLKLKLTPPLLVRLYKCYNPGRDHYKVYVDGQAIANFKSTTSKLNKGGVDGPHGKYDKHLLWLKPGRHVLKLKVHKEYTSGTCGGCARVYVPALKINKFFGRSFNESPRSFKYILNIPE